MLSIIHKKHKDRYRIRFCDDSFYANYIQCFSEWKMLFQPLAPAEKLTAWVVGMSVLRRADFYQGHVPLKNPVKATHPLTLLELFRNTSVRLPKNISGQMDLYEFISNRQIKALPKNALPSLAAIANLAYPVIITSAVPTPVELLTLQISGQRIISLNENYSEWATTLYSGRDYLGFLIHDLLHAEHFFGNPVHRDGQLGVYKFISTFMADGSLLSLLAESASFKEGFEYIISDMNSHPLHMLQTLHSLLFSSLKDDSKASAIWCRWVRGARLSDSETEALALVNAAGFSETHALVLSQLSLTTHAPTPVTGSSENQLYSAY